MTNDNQNDQKPGVITPEEELRRAEAAAAEAQRRLKELRSRQGGAASPAPETPAPAPQQAKPQRDKTGWHFDYSVKGALKSTVALGVAGLALYAVKGAMQPAQKLFMMGPNFLRDNIKEKSKATVSAIALAAAQVLGLGVGGMAAYDKALDATEFQSGNLTATARFGAAGFIAKQFISSSADSKDTLRNQPFFEALTNNTINSAAEVAHEARDQLASLDESKSDQPSRSAILRNSFVQVCTPQVIDNTGAFLPEARTAMNDGTMAQHFAAVNTLVDTMKKDQTSKLNQILLLEKNHVQLVVSPYTQAAKNITVTPVTTTEKLDCPAKHLPMTFEAEKWLSGEGLRPRGLDPK